MWQYADRAKAIQLKARKNENMTEVGKLKAEIEALKEALTEECMMKTPLEFDRSASALQWKNGTRLSIGGTFVDEGTYPPGITPMSLMQRSGGRAG